MSGGVCSWNVLFTVEYQGVEVYVVTYWTIWFAVTETSLTITGSPCLRAPIVLFAIRHTHTHTQKHHVQAHILRADYSKQSALGERSSPKGLGAMPPAICRWCFTLSMRLNARQFFPGHACSKHFFCLEQSCLKGIDKSFVFLTVWRGGGGEQHRALGAWTPARKVAIRLFKQTNIRLSGLNNFILLSFGALEIHIFHLGPGPQNIKLLLGHFSKQT